MRLLQHTVRSYYHELLVGKLCEADDSSAVRCNSILLGSLLLQLNNEGLWPWPESPFQGYSIAGLQGVLKRLTTPDSCACHRRWNRHANCTFSYHLNIHLKSVADLIEKGVRNLDGTQTS